jgi:hypothetical protein
MTSEARIVANRLNAQKSTGPRTAEGKAAVAQNAVKHGLSAQCDVIRGEDQEEFDQYREEVFWELNPIGVMQSRLAERIVSLAWRLRRAERLQNEAFDALLAKETSSPLARLTRSLGGREQDTRELEGCDGDPTLEQAVVRDFANARVLDRLLMYERRIESSLYRTMNELQKLRHERKSDADGEVRTVPVKASPKTQDVASLRSVATTEASCAKQSQSPPGDGVQCTPYECSDTSLDEETPGGVTANVGEYAKQSQCPPANAAVCSVPVRAPPETQDAASLRGVAASAVNSAEQSQGSASAAAAVA